MITKRLSDRLYERTGMPLLGWVSGTIATIGFVTAVILALWK